MYLNAWLQYLYFVFTSIAGKYGILYLYLNTFWEYFAQVYQFASLCAYRIWKFFHCSKPNLFISSTVIYTHKMLWPVQQCWIDLKEKKIFLPNSAICLIFM